MTEVLLDLGPQPVSNRFLPSDSDEGAPRYPMRLVLEEETGLLRLEQPFPVEQVRPCYEWLTCFEPEGHLDAMVDRILELPGVEEQSVFGGYSFKDDSTLGRIKSRGYRHQWGVQPERDLGVVDPCASIETFQEVFDVARAKQIRARLGYADVMIVRHVIEHAYKLAEFVSAICALVRPDGYIVWEIPDCERGLEAGDCTILWEEHTHYFTSFTFRQLLMKFGLSIIHYESVSYPLENSVVAITKRSSAVSSGYLREATVVSGEVARAHRFGLKVTERRKFIQSKLRAVKESGGTIAIFGAAHLAVTFLSIMNVADIVDFAIDDNANKIGMKMPVGNLDILGSESLYTKSVNLCLLGLNPQHHREVVERHSGFTDKGGRFASVFPGTELDLEEMV